MAKRHNEAKPGEACGECNGEGFIECFSDEYSMRGGHFTRDWTEPCEHCDGTAIEPDHAGDCDCDDCCALHDAAHPSPGITFGI